MRRSTAENVHASLQTLTSGKEAAKGGGRESRRAGFLFWFEIRIGGVNMLDRFPQEQ